MAGRWGGWVSIVAAWRRIFASAWATIMLLCIKFCPFSILGYEKVKELILAAKDRAPVPTMG